MKDETIIKILEALNGGSRNCGKLIYGQISQNVFHGYYYAKPRPGRPIKVGRCEMFFVKSSDGNFSGAVHWLGPDNLHWLVLPAYRQKGLLTDLLRESILPFIFDANPEMQKQTATLLLDRPQAIFSARLAEKVGFKKGESNGERVVFELSRDEVKQPFKSVKKVGLESSGRLKMIREMEIAFSKLSMIADEFEVKIGCGRADRTAVAEIRSSNRITMDHFQHLLRNGGGSF